LGERDISHGLAGAIRLLGDLGRGIIHLAVFAAQPRLMLNGPARRSRRIYNHLPPQSISTAVDAFVSLVLWWPKLASGGRAACAGKPEPPHPAAVPSTVSCRANLPR
jgi:hypothetical protein